MPFERHSTDSADSPLAVKFKRHAEGDGTLESQQVQDVLSALREGTQVTFLQEMNTAAFIEASTPEKTLFAK